MENDNRGILKHCWAALSRPSARYSLLGLLAVGFISGLAFWGMFSVGMDATNTLEFCTSCHEMRDTVYQEYKETIHYSNRSGVRATCSDCHVPTGLVHKLVRKFKASGELWGKMTGTISTPEKFEAKRLVLATREWQRMKKRGSAECRSCHSFDAMNPDIQKPSFYKEHMQGQAAGETCIDCHKGIAHLLPRDYEDPDEEE